MPMEPQIHRTCIRTWCRACASNFSVPQGVTDLARKTRYGRCYVLSKTCLVDLKVAVPNLAPRGHLNQSCIQHTLLPGTPDLAFHDIANLEVMSERECADGLIPQISGRVRRDYSCCPNVARNR